MNKQSDSELVTLLVKNNEAAFEVLYQRYIGRLRRFLSKIRLDQHVDDVIQETFLTIWRKRQSINPKQSFEAYLFTVAKNFALKALKKQLAVELTVATELGLTDHENPEQNLMFEELNKALLQSINKLPERPKQIFKLKKFQGLSTTEIANQLNLSKSTVENHMNRALTVIRKDLSISSTSLLFLLEYFV